MRDSDDPAHYRPQEVDEYHKKLARLRGLRGPTISTAVTRQARADKVAREQDADAWIKKLRARGPKGGKRA